MIIIEFVNYLFIGHMKTWSLLFIYKYKLNS